MYGEAETKSLPRLLEIFNEASVCVGMRSA